MPVEVATTIAQIDKTLPLGCDTIKEGDDHNRLVKSVLKDQCPGVGGNGFAIPINATEAEINFLVGVTSLVQAQLDTHTANIAAIVGEIPIGGIIHYSGTLASIPTNFNLCDGTAGTPDMTDKFAYGTNTELELEKLGGSADSVNVSHTHTAVAVGDHVHNLGSGVK